MGEALALDAAWLFAAFLIVLVLAASGIAARRFLGERGQLGVQPCGLRRPGGSWRLGIASYQLDEFSWYRTFGFSMRPEVVFLRRDLAVVARRPLTGEEVTVLGPGRLVAECQLTGSGEVTSVDLAQAVYRLLPSALAPEDLDLALLELDECVSTRNSELARKSLFALAESALTGLLVWLEGAPPGSHRDAAL